MGKNTSLNTGNLTNENKKKICEKKLENPDIRQSDLAEWAKRELHVAVAPTQGTISNILKRKEEYLSTKDLFVKRTRVISFPHLDTALANWVLQCQRKQIALSGVNRMKHPISFDIYRVTTE